MDSDSSDSMVTFANGVMAGAGAVVAVMAFVFMQLVGKYEGLMGISVGEMRVAVILGALVCAAAAGYEFYRKKPVKQADQNQV
jgi:hypothetical protein